MKVFEIIAKGIGKIWSFCSIVITVALVGAIVLCGLTLLMPENAIKAVEIIKGLIDTGGTSCGIWLKNISVLS